MTFVKTSIVGASVNVEQIPIQAIIVLWSDGDYLQSLNQCLLISHICSRAENLPFKEMS